MFHFRDNDLVIFLKEGSAVAVGDQVDGLGCAARENDF
jgi:hypothetical protein